MFEWILKYEQNWYLNGNYFWTILKGEQKNSVNGKYFWTIFEKWKKDIWTKTIYERF